jgi:four helix bundle protein
LYLEDLRVYKKLLSLALEIHRVSLAFPKFELYELGSQLRQSSNSPPANLAEGFGNRHTNIFLECIGRAQGEIRETKHHLRVAYLKQYLPQAQFDRLQDEYTECSKMLYCLGQSLSRSHKK